MEVENFRITKILVEELLFTGTDLWKNYSVSSNIIFS